MSRDQRVHLEDMLDAVEKARRFLRGRSQADIETDDQLAYAVIRALEILGEAAKRLSLEVRDLEPEIPWRQITGMRDKLTHAYDSIDLEVVWRTAQEELPLLVPRLEALLHRLDDSTD